eukprot:12414736-Ditylum_brightwellii.AAC.1
MDDVLKKQVQEAVDDVYTHQLRHKYSVYLSITTRDVLDHLMDRYGQIKPADLVANGVSYNKLMDISLPIDAYFARIDDCIQYASNGNTPYTAEQILTTTLHAMQRTGWFKERIRAWKAKNAVDKTWENFKKHFATEYDEIKEEQEVTVQAAGYTQANNVIQISDALENLANAAMADKRTVEDLSKANMELAEANKQLINQVAQITEQLSAIT